MAFTPGQKLEWFDFKFNWTKHHQTPEQLRHYLFSYDTVSSKALDQLDELDPPNPEAFAARKDIQTAYEPKQRGMSRDYFKLLKKHENDHPDIKAFWDEANSIPDWVDWAAIERGQKVFWKFAGPSMTGLAHLSLLGGMAGGRTVETLDRTGGFGALAVRRRLLETVQHTLAVHKDLQSMQPGGEGWEASLRVRLLHGTVRRRILGLAKDNPEYFSVKEHGVPISDLDTIGTINTFCAIPIWLGYPRQGIFLTQQETKDYIALWRYVGYVLGTPVDYMASVDEAKAMMESIMLSEYKPTQKSRNLANNIIFGFEGVPPLYASSGFLRALTYWLNGPQLSRALHIEQPSLYHMSLVASIISYFMVFGYVLGNIPIIKTLTMNFMKSNYYHVFIDSKEGGGLGYRTKFTFKWIPNLVNTTTPMGETDMDRHKHSGAFRKGGLERTALINVLFWLAAVGTLGYYGLNTLYKRTLIA